MEVNTGLYGPHIMVLPDLERPTKTYSLYLHSYFKFLFHIIKQLLTFMEVNTGLY